MGSSADRVVNPKRQNYFGDAVLISTTRLPGLMAHLKGPLTSRAERASLLSSVNPQCYKHCRYFLPILIQMPPFQCSVNQLPNPELQTLHFC